MKWVVTGAGGQLGEALCRKLDSNGINFVALTSQKLDITDKYEVCKAIERIEPQVIVNAAAWTDVDAAEMYSDSAFAVNETGVENLVIAAAASSSILVQISTDYVFGGVSKRPLSENAQTNPNSMYGRSKAAGETVVLRSYREHSYIVRTAWLYSEFGKNFAKTMCRLALSSSELVYVVSDQIGQPTSAHDLAHHLVELVYTEAKFGIYHGTNSGQGSWFDFAQEVFRLCGADIKRVIPVTSEHYPVLAKRPQYSVLAHSSWGKTKIGSMQEWRSALKISIPSIIDSVKEKG